MSKVILVAFRGEAMCFVHVLLNVLDMTEKGIEARLILEGEATKLLPQLEDKTFFLHHLWEKVRQQDLVEGVCRACATKMGTVEVAEKSGLKLLADMQGHPSLGRYFKEGWQVLVF
ncbi:MAG TPA: cytoplasmic protein [Thermodesulfatator atlanticus]|uniref:Cytoplasmic protein n=1 Tax=Thermodesulfatator atlanticus TaxID=501497 RepID=A0A7V5U1U7_9BACT|nr:cytoplasmic protein [Thermodesulfatator atlanticus]